MLLQTPLPKYYSLLLLVLSFWKQSYAYCQGIDIVIVNISMKYLTRPLQVLLLV